MEHYVGELPQHVPAERWLEDTSWSGAWVADSGAKTTLPRDASVAVVSWAAAHLASLTVHRLCQPGESISTACSIDTHQGSYLPRCEWGKYVY